MFIICLLEFGTTENMVEVLSSICMSFRVSKPYNKFVKHPSVINNFSLAFKIILIEVQDEKFYSY